MGLPAAPFLSIQPVPQIEPDPAQRGYFESDPNPTAPQITKV